MKTVIVLECPAQHLSLRASLSHIGYKILAEIAEPSTLHDSVARHAPDVIIVATDTPSVPLLHTLGSIAESSPRPVVMFARDGRRSLRRCAWRSRPCNTAAGAQVWNRVRLVRAGVEAACRVGQSGGVTP